MCQLCSPGGAIACPGSLRSIIKKPYGLFYSLTQLRAVRELRTVILSGWHSYEMDAAVKMLRGEEPFNVIN